MEVPRRSAELRHCRTPSVYWYCTPMVLEMNPISARDASWMMDATIESYEIDGMPASVVESVACLSKKRFQLTVFKYQ
jgi:hypothetical protein